MNKLILSIPLWISVILFTIGYVAHIMLGDNNAIEEMSEGLLKDKYGIDVEFSGRK